MGERIAVFDGSASEPTRSAVPGALASQPARVLLTADELNEITGWGRGRIYEMMADGRLPVVRAGRRVRIHWPTLERWFEEQAAAFDGDRLRDSLTAA